MWDFPIGTGATLVLRTFPFLLIRAAIYFGIAAAFVVSARGGAGIGWTMGALGGLAGRAPGAFWGAIGGLAFVGVILWWLREFLLYLVKAAHIAAMVRNAKAAPAGFGQVGHALSIVQSRFREAGILLAAEQLVQGTIGTLIEKADVPTFFLPAGLRLPSAPANAILKATLHFLGEVVFARPLGAASKNSWPETRDALTLLAQNQIVLLRQATLIAAAAYGLGFVVFIIALIPASALADAFPGGPGAITILFALIFAWSFKQALIEPFQIALMIEEVSRVTKGQSPDPDWDAHLTEVSADFREIKARAVPRGTRPSRNA